MSFASRIRSHGKAGLDGMQRLIAYETAGALSWKASMDRLQLHGSLRTFSRLPSYRGRTGLGLADREKGGFFKQDVFRPSGDTVARFMFYPSGFDKIGTIGSRQFVPLDAIDPIAGPMCSGLSALVKRVGRSPAPIG